MKEIKFDVILWDGSNPETIEHYNLEQAFMEGLIYFKDGGIVASDESIIIREYTSLKDKNGAESYFDDVIRWKSSTFLVVWDSEFACVMLGRLSGTDGMAEIPAHNIKQGEIIGNIWELEVKK